MFIIVACLLSLILSATGDNLSRNQTFKICRNYIDYFFANVSKNCYESPDILAQTNEIIQRHVGSCETYNVTTEDGYILTIFRIPPKPNPRGVIILQHPVTTDSIVWVGQSNESLAFLLWHEGYDVWLPNQRGTFFSQKHQKYNVTDSEFWNFSFHEIGLFDYKTIVDFVKLKTGQKIIFIAHSMSTTASLIYSSLRSEEAYNSIKIFIDMSPVCYLTHVRSPVKYLAYITPFLKRMNSFRHIYSLYGYNSESMTTVRMMLLQLPFKYLVSMMLSFMQGWNPEELDPAFVNLLVSQHPRSYPWKLFYHYVQFFQTGKFQMYDYGSDTNLKLYGDVTPPEYPLEKIVTPTYLIYSTEDALATTEDVEHLYSKLNSKVKIFGKLKVSGLNHVDFHYGKHRKEKVFDHIIKLINSL